MRLHTADLASYSNPNNCVEVAQFRKSSYSSARGQDCVEVADCRCGAAVRDTQNRNLGALAFPSLEWTALLTSVRT
ncbi:DUF397 domain-containing protein [Nocardiopsis ganjiahuensis]|uniref:DUF397 domain-containing protein n=1 Tax=Nocardiopsis ganjiahuensis TaxID=239984 RepID=UPI00034CA598|nr:DUF397 domain-containing protein [Nocardiopsis ganjiahuensis]